MSAFLQIPARNDLPFYTFSIVLSGVVFILTFRYNGRMQRWMMDIADSSGNPLLNGLPCLDEQPMTARFVSLALPAGDFACFDDSGTGAQPTRYSFGIDHSMIYLDPNQ